MIFSLWIKPRVDAECAIDVLRINSAGSEREEGGKGKSAGWSDSRWKDVKWSSKEKGGRKSVDEFCWKVKLKVESDLEENIIEECKNIYIYIKN